MKILQFTPMPTPTSPTLDLILSYISAAQNGSSHFRGSYCLAKSLDGAHKTRCFHSLRFDIGDVHAHFNYHCRKRCQPEIILID